MAHAHAAEKWLRLRGDLSPTPYFHLHFFLNRLFRPLFSSTSLNNFVIQCFFSYPIVDYVCRFCPLYTECHWFCSAKMRSYVDFGHVWLNIDWRSMWKIQHTCGKYRTCGNVHCMEYIMVHFNTLILDGFIQLLSLDVTCMPMKMIIQHRGYGTTKLVWQGRRKQISIDQLSNDKVGTRKFLATPSSVADEPCSSIGYRLVNHASICCSVEFFALTRILWMEWLLSGSI